MYEEKIQECTEQKKEESYIKGIGLISCPRFWFSINEAITFSLIVTLNGISDFIISFH